MIRALSLRNCVVLFILLSSLDLLLTRWLLVGLSEVSREANPIANWFLLRLDWAGFILFKVVTVLLTIGSLAYVARRRPTLAKTLMASGCALLLVVVGYSAMLIVNMSSRDSQESIRSLRKSIVKRQELANDARERQRFYQFEHRLYQDLEAGRLTLQQGARRVLHAELPWMALRFQECKMSNDRWIVEQRIATVLLANLDGYLTPELAKRFTDEHRALYEEREGSPEALVLR